MNRIPKPQEIYKHFKGNLYQIVTLAENSETGETMVIYQALYGEFKVYARPLEMFASKVDKVKYPDVEQEYRFELLQAGASYGVTGMMSGAAAEPQRAGCGIQKSEMELQKESCALQEPEPEQRKVHEETQGASDAPWEEEPTLDPLVWEFLDANSHEKRLNILAALHHRITDDMITTMAVASDLEVPDGELEERYNQLKNCLLMLDRFEIRRK